METFELQPKKLGKNQGKNEKTGKNYKNSVFHQKNKARFQKIKAGKNEIYLYFFEQFSFCKDNFSGFFEEKTWKTKD